MRTKLIYTTFNVIKQDRNTISCVFGKRSGMFKVAGPVIVVGVALSMLVGLIYYILMVCGIPI